MAKQEINLTKEIISPKQANKKLNINFQEVAKSPKPVDENTIMDTYKEFFYSIPKTGKSSHESISKQSYLFLNPDAESILESKIEARQSKLSLINERLFKLLSPSIKEHPIYPDGTILRINAEDTAGTNIQNPYIMQEGTKRYFANDMLYNIVRRALGQPEQDFRQDVIYISLQEAILIPDGEEIKTAADLNKKNIEIIDRIEDIPSKGLNISCVGTEATEYINNIVNQNTVDYSINLNEDCSLLIAETYYDDDGITLLSRIKEIKIPAVGANTEAAYVHTGTSISIPISSVPEMIEPAYGEYYNDWINREPYNSLVFEDRNKIWGKFPDGEYRKFPAIIKAVGRMYYQEEDDEGGWTSPSLLNGVSEDYLPDVPNHDGTTMSTFNTPMIFKDCKNRFGQPRSYCHGDLQQEQDLQEILNKETSNYYKPEYEKEIWWGIYKLGTISFSIYGQPIFSRNGRYQVFGGTRQWKVKVLGKTLFSSTVTLFYNINNSGGDEIDISWSGTSFLGSNVTGNKSFNYRNVDPSYIKYLGIQGKSLNHGGGFKYNPPGEDGSNDGLTPYMLQWLQ
jgi:hypothetical protein|tara:strand:+ start:1150 stop:2850 length:1701 start_codon:yes stop_codon:yes gene_type:complete